MADLSILTERHYERLLVDPFVRSELGRIICGYGDTDNTIYYGGADWVYKIVETLKGERVVY